MTKTKKAAKAADAQSPKIIAAITRVCITQRSHYRETMIWLHEDRETAF
jgi:hypothetical protein